MQKKDYILFIIFVAAIIAGCYFGGFFGGLIAGAFFVLLITISVGKILFLKSQKRIDAALRIKKMMQD